MMFLFSGRFGALASRIGPRWPMGIGPLLAAGALLLLTSLDSHPDYVTDVLPAMVLFGLGLSMTVAPLTTTVLDSVEERHAGIASGVNNAVARVAGVLAIAALGAVISAQFIGNLDDRLAGRQLGPQARAAVADAKEQPLSGGEAANVPRAEARPLQADILDSSESAFHVGMGIAAALMAVGGLISLVSVRRIERPPVVEPHAAPGPLAAAGECGRPAERRRRAPVPVTLPKEPAKA
jgi:MFS family permease